MRLVTVATRSDGYFPYLLQSCQRHRAKLDVLGWGERWQGYHWKILLMSDFLEDLPDDEVVCFIDGYDVLLLRPTDELEDAFRKVNSISGVSVILGCDRIQNPLVSFLAYLVFGKCRDKAINTGSYIGYVKDLKVMIRELLRMTNDPKGDDQIIVNKFCNRRDTGVQIQVDCDNLFFLTILRIWDIVDDHFEFGGDGMVTYKGTKPFIIHGNGNTNMVPLLRRLGYPISDREAKQMYRKEMSRKVAKSLYYLQYLIGYAVFLCVIAAVAVVVLKRTR